MINTNSDIFTHTQQDQLAFSGNWEKIKALILHWKQPKRFREEYILQSDRQIWGHLHYRRSGFIRYAIAYTAKKEVRSKLIQQLRITPIFH